MGKNPSEINKNETLSPKTDQPLQTAKEIGVFLKLSPKTIYNMVSEQRIPCYRINNKCVRFRISEIEGWLGQMKKEGRATAVPK